MILSEKKVNEYSRRQNMRLGVLLEKSGVSRTAYYSLVRKSNILPKSILRLAVVLGVNPNDLLDNKRPKKTVVNDQKRYKTLLKRVYKRANHICSQKKNKQIERDMVVQSLLALQKSPTKRLKMALLRGKGINAYQKGNTVF
jgi:hypothetical protein